MLQDAVQKTLGETFLLELKRAESRGLMFAALENVVAAHYPQYDLISQISKMSDFNSVATYQSKLARIRIEYNAKAVAEIRERLVGLNNFGQDNYKYKEKIVRKLNLLTNNNPTIDEIIYLTMNAYIERGYGSVEDFKRDICEHARSNASDGGNEKLSIKCTDDVCHV